MKRLRKRLRWFETWVIVWLLLGQTHTSSQTVPANFRVISIHSELDVDAIGFAVMPDERVLLIHQYSGQVKLLVDGAFKPDPLLTVPNLAGLVEKGLLGIALDPDFPSDPYVYLFHTFGDTTHHNRVSRFTIEGDLGDPNSMNLSIDPASQMVLVSDMPANNNSHNGGTLRFAADKTLLISHGDDRKPGRAQDLTLLNGKLLRVSKDGSIPNDNPAFPNEPAEKRPEILAFGLRNPFRFNIDPLTGDIFLGDVGEAASEELNVISPDGGQNLGWPRYEGSRDFDTAVTLSEPAPQFPIWEYLFPDTLNSVIALAVYRQKNYPADFSFPDEYEGGYFYADFYQDKIFHLYRDDRGDWKNEEFAAGFVGASDAFVGPDGAMYVLRYGQALTKIVYDAQPVSVELASDPERPVAFALDQNYPNPFNPTTNVRFTIPGGASMASPGNAQLRIYNARGELVKTLLNKQLAPGSYGVNWHGRDEGGKAAASGLYVVELQAGQYRAVRKMLLLR